MRRIIVILLGLALIVVGVGGLFRDTYGENIDEAAGAVAISVVASKINQSLREGVYKEDFAGSLLTTVRDEAGNIQYVEANSTLINKLILSFYSGVNENYSLGDTVEVPVNMGVLTGSKVLSQLPYTVDVRVMPLSLTKFQWESEFISEGINQTKYKIYCTVESDVQVLAPFTKKRQTINRRVLLAEAVVVGKVPDNYVFVPEEDILDVN